MVLDGLGRMIIIIIMRWIFMTDFVKGGVKLKWLRIILYAGL